MSDDARSEWSREGLARALVIAVSSFALGAGLAQLTSGRQGGGGPRQQSSASAPPSAEPKKLVAPSPEELAIVAPVVSGSTLGGYTVASIEGGESLRITCRKGEAEVRLVIVLASEGAPSPPARIGPFAVYYAEHQTHDGGALVQELGRVLRPDAKPPAGMKPWKQGMAF